MTNTVWTLILEPLHRGKDMNSPRPRCGMHNGIIPTQENHIAQRFNPQSVHFHAKDAAHHSFVAGIALITISIQYTLLRPKYIKQRSDSIFH